MDYHFELRLTYVAFKSRNLKGNDFLSVSQLLVKLNHLVIFMIACTLSSCVDEDKKDFNSKKGNIPAVELKIDPPKIKCKAKHGKNYKLMSYAASAKDKAPTNMLDHLLWQVAGHEYKNGWYLHLYLEESSENCKYLLDALLANNVEINAQRIKNTNQLFEFFEKKNLIKERSIEELKLGDILFWETSKLNLAVVSQLTGDYNEKLFIANQNDGPVLFSHFEIKEKIYTVRLLNEKQ